MEVLHHYRDVLFPSGDYLILQEYCGDDDFIIIVSDQGQVHRQFGRVAFGLLRDILFVNEGILSDVYGVLFKPAPIGYGHVLLEHFVGSLITNGIVRRRR